MKCCQCCQASSARMYDAEFSERLASSKLAMSGEDHQALAVLENSARLVDGH